MIKHNCKNVLPLKQYGPTCWFNALLTCILYSDQSRELLLKKSDNWNKKIKVLETIKYILKNKYLKTNEEKDYLYFDKVKPEYILGLLNKYNEKKFNIKEKERRGYLSILYIRKLYKLFGASLLLLDLIDNKNTLYYSKYNNYKVNYEKKLDIKFIHKPLKNIIDKYSQYKTPDVLIINDDGKYQSVFKESLDMKKIISEEDINNIKKLDNSVKLNGEEYILDSVILTSWNSKESKIKHAISGITCNNNRYIYNGWTRQTIDPALINKNNNLLIPCELMNFNWDIHKDQDFCLNTKTCLPDNITDIMIKNNIFKEEVCFSFNKGERIFIYIKKSKDSELITNNNKCKIKKVRNPLTNRCKKIIDINKKPKECPEGKILNPLTNRCKKIIDINKKPKECPEGKILNPLTNRCKKIIKSKECPEGKILNPLTNRCKKIIKSKECPEGKILKIYNTF